MGYPNMTFGLAALGTSLCVLCLCYSLWWRRTLSQFPELVPASKASASLIDELERSMGGSLPAVLRAAYLDGSIEHIHSPMTVQCRGMECAITGFIAAGAESNERLVESCGISKAAFIFATDHFGNYYFVKPTNNAIYYWDHDGGDISQVVESADEFWKALRT
jgi:hypothetical protein